MKLSDWQSAKKKPKLKGWYQCKAHSVSFAEGTYAWRYWTGKHWEWYPPETDYASFNSERHPSSHEFPAKVDDTDEWRGVL